MENNFENQKDELRNSLSTGGFGSESESAADLEEVDEKVDNALVQDFVSGFGSYKHSDYIAHVPGNILDSSNYSGYLRGISREETEAFYVIDSAQTEHPVIGYIANEDSCVPGNLPSYGIIITRRSGELECKTVDSEPVHIKRYDEQVKLFSRNSGLLESDWMLDKRAVIIGCGSVGSFIAMQLARSGVGKFALCDTDILEIHNICRHQCGFDDLGRYKVDAVRDKILNINPKADVTVFRSVIQRIPKETLTPLLGVDSIIIGTGDNRESSRYACDNLAIPTNTPFVTTCCWTRAFAGEVIYWMPGKNLPCYQCSLGDLVDSEADSAPVEPNINYWGKRNEAETLSFEPGIAADIDFVSLVAVKIILDLINRDNPNYTSRVINHLTQYTWVCNTNEVRIGGEKAGIFSHPLQITHNLRFRKKDGCPICGDKD